jgi:hypothetical protein
MYKILDGKESAKLLRAEFANRVEGMLNLTQSAALESLDTLKTKRFEEILENIVFDGLNNCGKRVLTKYRPQKNEEKTLKID